MLYSLTNRQKQPDPTPTPMKQGGFSRLTQACASALGLIAEAGPRVALAEVADRSSFHPLVARAARSEPLMAAVTGRVGRPGSLPAVATPPACGFPAPLTYGAAEHSTGTRRSRPGPPLPPPRSSNLVMPRTRAPF
jgi:hypothetical protein